MMGPTTGEVLLDVEEKKVGFQSTPSALFSRKNSMRNKPCGCGSGKKFKKCCWNKFNVVSL